MVMRTTRRATLADVAARAGVSPTTASYILNDRTEQMRISSDTAERVRSAVDELGYRPNRSARSLRTARTSTIGVISDFLAGGHYASQMVLGAGVEARASDHLLIIGESDADPALEAKHIEEMLDHRVDGIIYATRTASRVRVPEALHGARTVLLNCTDERSTVASVLPDDRQGGVLAAECLLAAGLSRGIYVVGRDPLPEALAGPRRTAGVQDGLGAAGSALSGILDCDWTVAEAFSAVLDLLDTGAEVRALVCLNDRVAMGAYQALAERGLRVPTDVGVLSFDGSELAEWLRPAVVSMRLPFEEMGALAVRLILEEPTGARAQGRGVTTLLPLSVQPGGSLPPALPPALPTVPLPR